MAEIKDYEDRLSHTRDLLATRQIEAEDYREMKSAYSSKISALEAKLNRVNYDSDKIQDLVKQGINKIIEIKKNVVKGELAEISKDIGSIYPEKIIFSESQVRTARRNDFIQHINLINKKLYAKKNGTKVDFSTLSREVGVAGFEPAASCSQSRRDNRATLHPVIPVQR